MSNKKNNNKNMLKTVGLHFLPEFPALPAPQFVRYHLGLPVVEMKTCHNIFNTSTLRSFYIFLRYHATHNYILESKSRGYKVYSDV